MAGAKNRQQMIEVVQHDPLDMAMLDLNDLGNAERLCGLAEGRLAWVEPKGWAAFDGKRWTLAEGERLARMKAHEVARHVDAEARALAQLSGNEVAMAKRFGAGYTKAMADARVIELRKWAQKTGQAQATSGMLTQAKNLLWTTMDDYDADPLAFNVQNGTLRFVQADDGGGLGDATWLVTLSPHEPTDRIMQLAAVSYDPGADCPGWLERLEIVQPDPACRSYLQQIYGYMLTGKTGEQCYFVFQGKGGDGKSATNNIIAWLMGDYYRHAAVQTFLEGARKSGSDHSSDLARLSGDIRFVSCDEPPRGAVLNETIIKQVTGGGTVTARALREAEMEFTPRWKLIMEVNPLPGIRGGDDGIWRRTKALLWPFQFGRDNPLSGGRIKRIERERWDILERRLKAEGAGILNWMIAGACAWLGAEGLTEPNSVSEVVEQWRSQSDPFGDWYLTRCDTRDPDVRTGARLLYDDFKAYCEALGMEKPPTQTAFGRALGDRQHKKAKDGGGNITRQGIQLRTLSRADEAWADAEADRWASDNGGSGGVS